MYIGFSAHCLCGNSYTVSESISTDKIVCPNCGLTHPYSDKLISILKTASEIPCASILDKEVSTHVISFSEYVNDCQ